MKLLALCVLALVALVVADDPWKSCSAGAHHMTIKSLTITPNPLTVGKPFTIVLAGDMDEAMNGGQTTLEVKYLGVKILSKTINNCDYPEIWKCPVGPGPVTQKLSDTIPGATPRGTYSGMLKSTDQTGSEVACLTFSIKVAVGLDDPAVDMGIIDLINSDPKSSWVAGVNNQFEGMTVREAQKMLGAVIQEEATMPNFVLRGVNVPESFDARTQWPDCPHGIRDQGHCGSCWAFAISEAMTERFCVASKGAKKEVLSPQWFVSCDKTDLACQGGYLDRSWKFAGSEGTVTDSCFPYESGSGAVPACITACKDGKPMTKFKVVPSSVVNPKDLTTVQTALMNDGAIEVAFTVYQDFMSYKSGVYEHKSGAQLGGHAVKCIGWGVENGVKYWLLANSWGTSWATLGGFFKFIRGTNNCGIENNLWYAKPEL